MSRRIRFGPTTDGTLDTLQGQLDTGNENGNNPDNDFVIRDSTGTIVARYNESATTWQLEQPLDLQSNNVTNVGALDTERLAFDDTVLEAGDFLAVWSIGSLVENPSDTTTTSFERLADGSGYGLWAGDEIPNGCTLYARLWAQMKNEDVGEEITLAPEVRTLEPTESQTIINEVEISTDSESYTDVHSGWQEVETDLNSDAAALRSIQGKVSGGTGEVQTANTGMHVGWRVD